MTIESRLKKSARSFAAAPDLDMAPIAQRDGLLDVAYAEVETPFGRYLAAATERGLLRLAHREAFDEALDEIAKRVSPRILEGAAYLDPVRRELDEYFEGKRRRFDFPLDWRLVTGFSLKVLQATAKIPYGSVSTYKDMATRAGSPRAARAAGNALHNIPIPLVVPCHRVLHSGGGMGGYGGGLQMKESLLRLEGAIERLSKSSVTTH